MVIYPSKIVPSKIAIDLWTITIYLSKMDDFIMKYQDVSKKHDR